MSSSILFSTYKSREIDFLLNSKLSLSKEYLRAVITPNFMMVGRAFNPQGEQAPSTNKSQEMLCPLFHGDHPPLYETNKQKD